MSHSSGCCDCGRVVALVDVGMCGCLVGCVVVYILVIVACAAGCVSGLVSVGGGG